MSEITASARLGRQQRAVSYAYSWAPYYGGWKQGALRSKAALSIMIGAEMGQDG